jgi:hypothetical protein
MATERDPGDKADSFLSPSSESMPPLSQITTTSWEQRITSQPNGHWWALRSKESRGACSKQECITKGGIKRDLQQELLTKGGIKTGLQQKHITIRWGEDEAIGIPPLALDPLHSNSKLDKERSLVASHFQQPPRHNRDSTVTAKQQGQSPTAERALTETVFHKRMGVAIAALGDQPWHGVLSATIKNQQSQKGMHPSRGTIKVMVKSRFWY